MAIKHGVYITEAATASGNANAVSTGIAFVVGTAPLTEGSTAKAGDPVLVDSYEAAVAAVGYSDDWATYTLCEVIDAHFNLFKVQPLILVPLASGAEADAVAAAVEKVELCMTAFNVIPDVLLAPGFSNNATVAAALTAKAEAIVGMFGAMALIDIEAASYTAAISAKPETVTGNQILCWPKGKIGSKVYHLSTLIAGVMAATDYANDSVPYRSPSNQEIHITGLVAGSDNTELIQTFSQANALNDAGIVTALNKMGAIVAWGNYTAVGPQGDIKDRFIPVARMFDYVAKSMIFRFWENLDAPMNRRLVDSIVDQGNIWMNGMVGAGYLLGGRVELLEAENTVTDLLEGRVKLHVYLTPPTPAQEIDFTMEYDSSYATNALV